MVFRGWERFEPTSVELKILFDGFFERTGLLALAGVESLSSSAKKETEVKLGRPL